MRRVLILHTGGTLGMTGHPLEPGDFAERLLDHVPELSRLAALQVHIECNLDSTNLGPAQWASLAARVSEYREAVDGFVIIHGTDTMAYTASALSFILKNLGKHVVVTGSQVTGGRAGSGGGKVA